MTGEVKLTMPLPSACQAIGCDYMLAWRAVLKRQVPAERRGRSWYVNLDDLRTLMRAEPFESSGAVAGRSVA